MHKFPIFFLEKILLIERFLSQVQLSDAYSHTRKNQLSQSLNITTRTNGVPLVRNIRPHGMIQSENFCLHIGINLHVISRERKGEFDRFFSRMCQSINGGEIGDGLKKEKRASDVLFKLKSKKNVPHF